MGKDLQNNPINIKNEARDAEANLLEDNLILKNGNLLRLGIALTETQTIQYTIDGGINYMNLNSGQPQLALASHIYEFQISDGDLFNVKIQSDDAWHVIFAKAEVFLES